MIAERGDESRGAAPLKPGDLFRQNYRIHRLIGQGGYAWVYHARHCFIDRHVAIKILKRPGGIDRELLRRTLAEAQIQHKLVHPNIVKVDDAGVADGLPYLVMELLRGWSWRDMLKAFARVRVDEALRLAASVADAMQVAHDGGVIHRDLKPENIFVVAGNQPKVLDFGIAKINQAAWATKKDVVLGTMIYMSPEQIQALAITPRSDIYSLGVILYEALSGRHPVNMLLKAPMNLFDVSRIVVGQMAPRLDALDPKIPPYVADLVDTACAKPARRRFGSMVEFGRAMRECLERYEWDELRRGSSLGARNLSRPATIAAAGVQVAGGADTEPNSRPTFLGAVSSGTLGDQAKLPSDAPAVAPAVRTPPVASVAKPAHRELPRASRPPKLASETPPNLSRVLASGVAAGLLVAGLALAFHRIGSKTASATSASSSAVPPSAAPPSAILSSATPSIPPPSLATSEQVTSVSVPTVTASPTAATTMADATTVADSIPAPKPTPAAERRTAGKRKDKPSLRSNMATKEAQKSPTADVDNPFSRPFGRIEP